MLKEAQRLSQRLDGSFPFADFIGRLLPDISDKRIAKFLIRWGAHITGETVGSFKQSAKREAPSVELDGSPRPHLIVQLAPNLSPLNKNKYRVSFHLYSEKSDGRSLADPEKELEDLLISDIEAELDEFLRRLDDDALPKAVEIMVPGDYLTAIKPPPHLWRLKAGRRKGRERLLGKKYPVYLRLNRYERLTEDRTELDEIPTDQRLSWKTKWLEFRNAKSPADCIQWEYDPAACSWESLDKSLCNSKGWPCLVLTFEPKIPPDDAWLDDVLLESGVPVALWGDVGEADIKTLLKPLIDGGSLRNLPARLREKRDATDQENYPYLLTLLWDNPERDIHKRGQDTEERHHYDMNVLS